MCGRQMLVRAPHDGQQMFVVRDSAAEIIERVLFVGTGRFLACFLIALRCLGV